MEAPGVAGELCGLASPGLSTVRVHWGGSGCGPPRHTHALHVELQRHSWTGLAAGRLLSVTGKQKQTARDWAQTS